MYQRLNENMRGRWADFVAVQEDLTWETPGNKSEIPSSILWCVARFPFRFLMEFLKIEVIVALLDW